jgi:hypothetical protein
VLNSLQPRPFYGENLMGPRVSHSSRGLTITAPLDKAATVGESPSANASDVQDGDGSEKTASMRVNPSALLKGGSGKTVFKSVKCHPPQELKQDDG